MKKAKSVKATKKRNGRYMVCKRGGKVINGEDKVKFLQEAGLAKKLKAKAKPAAVAPAEGAQ